MLSCDMAFEQGMKDDKNIARIHRQRVEGVPWRT